MKKPSKKKIILIVLSIIFGFSTLINTNSYYNQDNNSGYLESDNEQKLKRAGYWNVPPFIINGNSGWETINSTYEWVNGNGTWSDPYVIENITIDGEWSGSCVEIQNSDVFFIIRNSTFYYSGTNYEEAGIKLVDTNNGRLINNTSTNN